MNQVGQHVAHMIQLGFAVAVRIVEAVVDDPVLLRQRIHVHAVHHADALDQTVSVAAVLTSDQLDLVREILIDDRVVKRDATFLVSRDLFTHVVPYRDAASSSRYAKNRLMASWLISSTWSAKFVSVWLIGLTSRYWQ